jgi:hypothetical protein
MSTKPIAISEWKSLPGELDNRVEEVLQAWCGTPYLEQTRIRAMGVDCFQIVAAFLDEMMGEPPGTTELPRLSANIARHRPDLAMRAIRVLREAHGGSDEIRDGSVEVGDIIVVRSIQRTDGPLYEGHTMIASPEPYRVLHAVSPRACWTTCAGREVVKVYRPKEKHRWT